MVNKQILVGRIGRDPEIKEFNNGGMVANVALATDNRWRDKATGEQKSVTTWHRVIFRGKLAELAQQYLSKGSMIYVEGRTDHRKYTDPNSNQERTSVEVVANELRFLDSKGSEPAKDGNAKPVDSPPDDEFPF